MVRLRKGSPSIVLLLQGLKNKRQQKHPATTSYINLLKSSLLHIGGWAMNEVKTS